MILKSRQVAEILGLAPGTIRKWAREGKLPYVQIDSNKRFDSKKLERLFNISLEDYKISKLPVKRPKRRNASNGFRVYFAQVGNDGLIKIGVSKSIERRLSDLKVSHPEEIIYLGSIEGGSEKESKIQNIFKEINVGREWFQPDPKLIKFILVEIAKEQYETMTIERLRSSKKSCDN